MCQLDRLLKLGHDTECASLSRVAAEISRRFRLDKKWKDSFSRERKLEVSGRVSEGSRESTFSWLQGRSDPNSTGRGEGPVCGNRKEHPVSLESAKGSTL